MQDRELDIWLSKVHVAPVSGQFTQRVVAQAISHPQKKTLWHVLSDTLVDVGHDVFGTPCDTMIFNIRWRLASIALMMLIGFSAGYYEDMMSFNEEDTVVDFFNMEEPDITDIT